MDPTLTRSALVLTAALAAMALSAPSSGGIWNDDPRELRPLSPRGQLKVIGLQVKVSGLGWVGPGHRRPSDHVPRLLALGDAFQAPPGDWSDVVLDLDGPVVVTVERLDGRVLRFEADLDALTVPLDEPVTAGWYALDLALPDLLPVAAGARAALVADGLGAVSQR